MDNQPPTQPSVPQPVVDPNLQPYFVNPVQSVNKQNRVMEYTSLAAVIILFVSLFLGVTIIAKSLLILFAIFGAVYVGLDYMKNRKLTQEAQVYGGQLPAYQRVQQYPGQQVIYVVQEKPPKSTAQKAFKIALITGGSLLIGVVVLPVLGIILLIIVFSAGGGPSS